MRTTHTRLAQLLFMCHILLGACFVPTVSSDAQELRIETKVFGEEEDDEPLSHTVTLFDKNTVYDFVENPEQIAIFRAPTPGSGGQFILLDVGSARRTEVSTEQISGLMQKLSKWAAEQKDPLLKFSAKPKFKETFDRETGVLMLTSDLWEYNVATIPADSAPILARYREFTDWYTRLNTMMNSSPPPGPRLELNSSLEKYGVMPVEIRRTLKNNKSMLRATHLFTWRLSREDRVRLDEARKYLASFKKVDNEAFIAAKAEHADVVRGQSE
ncbi:MAG: hypothetical protein SH868_06090 [Bythopirellula sp.]|nr:hypothetical protein [Bythopirellula sp.]